MMEAQSGQALSIMPGITVSRSNRTATSPLTEENEARGRSAIRKTTALVCCEAGDAHCILDSSDGNRLTVALSDGELLLVPNAYNLSRIVPDDGCRTAVISIHSARFIKEADTNALGLSRAVCDSIIDVFRKLSELGTFRRYQASSAEARIMHGLASLREEMLADMARIKLIEFLFAGSASDSKPTERKAPEADNVIETVHGDLEDHLGDHITIEDIAHSYFMSPATLKNRYKARYGVPLATDLRAMRMSRARTLLSKTDKKMSDIAKEVGYDNQSKFSAAFRDFTGLTPSKWRAFNRLPGKAIDIDSFLSDEEARTDDSALGVSSNGPRDAVRSLLENLDVPASVVSPDYTIVFANAAYCELFDVEDGDEVGQLCYDLQYGLDAPCSFCRTKEVFEQGKSAMWECIFKNEPKMVFEFPLYDTDGTILKLEIRIPLSKLEAKPVQKGYEHVQRMCIDERG